VIYQDSDQAYFEVVEEYFSPRTFETLKRSELAVMWVLAPTELRINHVTHQAKINEVFFFTEFDLVELVSSTHARFIRFNRAFYCILDHDHEVGCKGLLYFGSSSTPQIQLVDKSLEVMEKVWPLLLLEMESNDNLQLEMLQMMLKRILILCTRVLKQQESLNEVPTDELDIIRSFNFLVESHFKKHHDVNAYARLLFKSPKTLANTFKKANKPSPSQYIKDRIATEAKHLLAHSDLSISEVGYELGYKDVQSFSRFFRTQTTISPLQYRENPLRE
jgi:AraC-like DNA-binding protein